MSINKSSSEAIAGRETGPFQTQRYFPTYSDEEIFHLARVQDPAGQTGPKQDGRDQPGPFLLINNVVYVIMVNIIRGRRSGR